jgi:predicted RNA-binding Zn-ribbon protein involved in translation (DUF1610 family)
MNDTLQDLGQALCIRCGAEANCRFADAAQTLVEIVCPDCGRFEIPRVEFEQYEFDMAQAEERR